MAVPKPSKMHQRVNQSAEERKLNTLVDKTPPPNNFWDDAENLYQKSMLGLEQSHGQLAEHLQHIISTPDERAKIRDMPGLVTSVNILTKDIAAQVEALNVIHDKHVGRTGSTVTEDEHMAILAIHGQYFDALQLFNTIIMPTVTHIFEQTNITDDLIAQQITDELNRKELEAQDVNVVTDVFVKTTEVIEVQPTNEVKQ